ncbi:hypothetical protein PV797_11045 [Clostridiaceae bacterium M8S5]|nr:hypothetical protein PV797_11045 [Clostridiaceae bacterium M8S5]
MKKCISILLVVVFIFNLSCISFASTNVKVNVTNKYSLNGTSVEEGEITVTLADGNPLTIKYSEKSDLHRKTTILNYGNTTETIETNFDTNVTYIKRNGIMQDKIQANDFDKYCKNDTKVYLRSTPSFVKTPYSDKEVAVKSFDYNGTKMYSRVKEYYDWEFTDYTSKTFKAFTAVATIAAFATIGISTTIAIIASACTLVNGVLVINDLLTVTNNAIKETWNKYGEIDNDEDCWNRFHAGRTKITKWVGFNNGEYKSDYDIASDSSTRHFYDNIKIAEIAAQNYIEDHNW